MLYGKNILCPSSRCEKDAILLDVVKENGHIIFIRNQIRIDQDFANIAHMGRSPEKRFRFANKCLEGECKQWTGTRCGIIDEVIEKIESGITMNRLPDCPIWPCCRWFKQHKTEACNVCPEIITDLN